MKRFTAPTLRTEEGIILRTCERTQSGERESFTVLMEDEVEVELEIKDRRIRVLSNLADERHMISDLIMDDSFTFLDCVFGMHDAHSFWDAVRKAHANLEVDV